MSQILIHNLIRQFNELEDGSLWFDQSIKDKIDGLSEEEAFTEPHPKLHSVAEHVSHMLEWRKECILRFKGQRTELMNSPDDWKTNATLREAGWAALKNSLYQSRFQLIDLIANKDDAYLETKFQDTDYNFHYLLEGIIQHDLYHMGQMGISIKLVKETNAIASKI